MPRRQPLPRLWMMTDERQGSGLLLAVKCLPRGSGIVFRHYSLPEPERRRLFDEVREASAGKKCVLMVAGTPQLALVWGADGSHGWDGAGEADLLRSASVHNSEEMESANRLPADLAFISPVFESRSHPGQQPLGAHGLKPLAEKALMPVIALGGMNEERAAMLGGSIHGWAGIDAWSAGQD